MLATVSGGVVAGAGAPLDVVAGAGGQKAVEGTSIQVIQVNLNKSNAAQLELTIKLKRSNNFLCLVTEPAVLRKSLSCLPKHYNVLPSERGNSPRAAIFSSQSVPIHEITSLRHRDLVVGLIMCGTKKTAIISAYMDIKQEAIPKFLTDAIDYCKSKGYSILLGVDTNSHHKLWGNTNNNRGVKWSNLIEEEKLLVHNKGRVPTYESKLGKSIIDVTLSKNLKWEVTNWRVLRSYNGTDHNSIHFNLERVMITIPEHRQYNKADWKIFTDKLKDFGTTIPSEITECKLDKLVAKLNYGIKAALDKACPLTKPKTIDPNNSWWTPELKQLRKEVSKSYDCLLYTSPSPRDRQKSRMPSSA